jgi:hypothetical protein
MVQGQTWLVVARGPPHTSCTMKCAAENLKSSLETKSSTAAARGCTPEGHMMYESLAVGRAKQALALVSTEKTSRQVKQTNIDHIFASTAVGVAGGQSGPAGRGTLMMPSLLPLPSARASSWHTPAA